MVVKLIPVCECGHIFYGGVSVTVEQYVEDDLFREVHVFNPRVCPGCGEPITGVMYKDIHDPRI